MKKINQDFQMIVKLICKLHIAKRKKKHQQLTYMQGLK